MIKSKKETTDSIKIEWGGYEPNHIYNVDAYQAIKCFPDKSIDLIFTDPPYGIDAAGGVGGYGSSKDTARHYDSNTWDKQPPPKWFFEELLRVGKKIIIFGGNYFTDKLPVNGHWLVWDKISNIKFNNPFSDCELVWTNIKKNIVKKYIFIQQGFITEDKTEERVHPTQKPIKLMKEIIEDYSQEGDLVVDFFAGSGSIVVAAKELKRNYIGFELDSNYYKTAKDRLEGITQYERKVAGVKTLFDYED